MLWVAPAASVNILLSRTGSIVFPHDDPGAGMADQGDIDERIRTYYREQFDEGARLTTRAASSSPRRFPEKSRFRQRRLRVSRT